MGLRARHYRGYGPTVARRGLGSWKCALLTRGMRLVGSTMRLAALARTSGPAERDISHRHRQQMTPVSVAGRPHRSHFVAIAWRAAIRAAVRGRTGLGGDYTFDGRGKRGERRWGSVRVVHPSDRVVVARCTTLVERLLLCESRLQRQEGGCVMSIFRRSRRSTSRQVFVRICELVFDPRKISSRPLTPKRSEAAVVTQTPEGKATNPP